ncbi:hypothetical protein PT974_01669 [Cladobotryum mycophilum]|uniref:ubiquitinyl hydrolase 1 n=1 Tax=Cladobotryum mycophilum TaxID=491253 RepID=A0ABR0T5L0_9HYPO
MESSRAQQLEDVFNHLVLPPELPGKVSKNVVILNQELGKQLQDACAALRSTGNAQVWDCLIDSLATARKVHQECLSREEMLTAFNLLARDDVDIWLIFHVAQQNAALLVHKDTGTGNVVFEAFEASASAPVALEANNALRWDFPSRAVAISMVDFTVESFQENLSEFLEQASAESFDRFAARGHKGGTSVVEVRDTPSPALISEMLMSLLEGMGSSSQVYKIQKRVRDDVILHNAELPWRRSPYWLILRVASQRILSTRFSNSGIDRWHFKLMMCMVLSQFLNKCVGVLHPEKTLMLQAKLCRRLAKLEFERSQAAVPLQSAYDKLFENKRSFFEGTVNNAQKHVTNAWNEYKGGIGRPVPRLPTRIHDRDLRLTLTNSGKILKRLLTQKTNNPHKKTVTGLPQLAEGTVSQVNNLATRYSALVSHESRAMTTLSETASIDSQTKCERLSQAITDYISAVKHAYDNESQLMSRYLLNVFELWVAMDGAATKACPLLRNYHPIFVPEALDLLCLHTKSDMSRLLKIQHYLAGRIKLSNKKSGTIFSRPQGAFAFSVQYVYQTKQGRNMMSLASRIDEASDRSKQTKIAHLKELMDQYNTLIENIQKGTCACTRNPDDGTKSRCTKCLQKRTRRKLKIGVHEDFLPLFTECNTKAQRSAIIFELAMPQYFSFYRRATWKIMTLGVHPSFRTSDNAPAIKLGGVSQLTPFWTATTGQASVTLASRKKSFLQTHYKELRMPKKESEILLPFGAEFSYYDSDANIWADDLPDVPWYHHLLGFWLPQTIANPYEDGPTYMKDKLGHPTSYEIAANQLDCPSGMSVHEFSAYQRAISGGRGRWLVLLVELGAANMNFSSGTTTALLNYLALQAGRYSESSSLLREVHVVFGDESFCQRLSEELCKRLDALESSCRETNYMSLIVTLALRLYYLCPPTFQPKSLLLLMRIREILSSWIAHLRNEVRSTDDGEIARKAANHAFWSALLCRHTFTVYVDDGTPTAIGKDSVRHFFNASIALSEHLVINLDELQIDLQYLLRRDLSMSYSMRSLIAFWAKSYPNAVTDAINETWVDIGGLTRRSYSTWKFLAQPYDGWLFSQTVATNSTASQTVHYHLLQGHLLIDGKPLGRLPLEMREDCSIQELFGRQHLLTRPSGLPGMEYQLVNDVHGHEIHFGFRHGKVLTRARFRGKYLEHVPRTVFKGPSGTDLPSALVDDCVHWLNLNNGELEMRQKPRIWKRKFSNWVLDVCKRTAIRNRKKMNHWLQRKGFTNSDEKLGSCLIDPRSEVGRQIAEIFRHFEDADKLTIYRPLSDTRCFVEMKRLGLSFFINFKGLLQSRQLRAEVDPIQDIGTLHGLASKVILRSVTDPTCKSVLVPIGPFSWQRAGMHVSVSIQNDGTFARFDVNHILGRLECAPEPLLLYLKALLHAITSFPIPDTLTGRTGTEEAYHCLQSAHSQPWTSLHAPPKRILSVLQGIGPKRHYYPLGSKLYQNVSWDNALTMSIQQEQLGALATSILDQCQKLETFQPAFEEDNTSVSQRTHMDHLTLRGVIRRQLYERVKSVSDSDILTLNDRDVVYIPRDRDFASPWSCQVYQTMQALQEEVSGVAKLERLDHLLRKCDVVGNFQHTSGVQDIQLLLDTDLLLSWGSLVQACRSHNTTTRYNTAFKLALLAFSKKSDMRLIMWLVTQAKHKPSQAQLYKLIMVNQQSHESFFSTSGEEKERRNTSALNATQYDAKMKDEASNITNLLITRWPMAPSSYDEFWELANLLSLDCVNIDTAWDSLEPEMQRLSRNWDLSSYIQKVGEETEKLSKQQGSKDKEAQRRIWHSKPKILEATKSLSIRQRYRLPRLTADLMGRPYCPSDKTSGTQISQSISQTSYPSPLKPLDFISALPLLSKELSELHGIANHFVTATEATRQQYGKDLNGSIMALATCRMAPQQQKEAIDTQNLNTEILEVQKILSNQIETIKASLSWDMPSFLWLNACNLWPCLSPLALLEELRSDRITFLGKGMKTALIQYGVLMTNLQRLLRMENAKSSHGESQPSDDWSYQGHSNWNPAEHPEWLLLEIDNNLLIRPSQVDVARAIVSPASGHNSVLQMNMGQGKTSCIMPMAVTMLADRKSLCRLIVPKALLLQTAQVVQSRIGGLIGRVVRHIPFARRSPANMETINRYQAIHQDTLELGGVMICLPEHILSFKLSGLQRLADDQLLAAKQMVGVQQWLERSCRDILDESDFTLSAKTQLIYPGGPQAAVDGNPHRWLLIEEILSLVQKHAPLLEERFPDGVKVVWRHQGYPILYFLRPEPENFLNSLLVDDVCKGRIPMLRLKDTTSDIARLDVERIISGADVSAHDWERAGNSLADRLFGLKSLHLLRGLISQGIVLLCLKKRWNVQYGLHPERVPLAVPFEAKGVPSQTAEYGHPDTALILTCLAFYQTGLTMQQIVQGLERAVKADDPAAQYDRWISGCDSLPSTLHHWNLINPDDEIQVRELWKHLRFNRHVLNDYMNTFVFPVHAKQFSIKIQASGWDIPLLANGAIFDVKSPKQTLTTGFSGTNDNKRMLPGTIRQDDLPSLLQTNAEVLCYLLEERNQRCYQAADKSGHHLTEIGLLNLLKEKGIRILIDAGAHILEMGNYDVAGAWLDIDTQAAGAVYFGPRNEILVRSASQKAPMPLLASPFADDLTKCVVYIDEGHTRGTDLKLPPKATGAVTLGIGQTKDQTVQAAMRLRQLGSTQSVAFMAPPEVYRSIIDARSAHIGNQPKPLPVTSIDVVRWLLEQSCKSNEQLMSLHVAQGLDFCRRTNALWKHAKFLTVRHDLTNLLAVMRQREHQTLEQLYGPRDLSADAEPLQFDIPQLQAFAAEIEGKRSLLSDGTPTSASAFMEVEQEREVEFEVEQIREDQIDARYTPLKFPGLHGYIKSFISTGCLDPNGSFLQAFEFIGTTKTGKKFGIKKTVSKLFVSKEFTNTVVLNKFDVQQHMLRPVEWILWSDSSQTALIINSEEADAVLPMLRDMKPPRVWLICYAAPVTKSMQVFNCLNYFTVPSVKQELPFPDWLKIEVGIIAGRLYFCRAAAGSNKSNMGV